MGDIQDIINPHRDYVGGILGHCVSSSDQESTFVTFDVPATGNEFALQIQEDEETLTLQWNSFASDTNREIVSLGNLGATVTQVASIDETQQASLLLTQDANETKDAFATQTATLWTPTSTLTPSNTPTSTFTPTVTSTATITNTPRPTNTATITNTPRPTNTRQPTALPSGTTYYSEGNGVNVRSCPRTSCEIVVVLGFAQEIEIIDTDVQGDTFNGSTRWMEGVYNGQVVYVHSELVSRTRPQIVTAVPQSNTSSTTNNTGGSSSSSSSGSSSSNSGGSGGDTSVRPGNCATAVAMNLTAQQAGQWRHLDRDGDGEACYGT